MAKVLLVLYDDPVDGYPKSYPINTLPKIERYPGGQTVPSPKAIDFKPGELLGSVSGELGLRKFLEAKGHTLVVTSDRDGANSTYGHQHAGDRKKTKPIDPVRRVQFFHRNESLSSHIKR